MGVAFPWETEPAAAPAPSVSGPPKRRGRRPAPARPKPYWRYYHLVVTGPDADIAAFIASARGPGVTPWHVDGAALEEDVFNLAASQPTASRGLTVEGCRILARQFRDRVEARQARAAAQVGYGLGCPFDLHRLLPVPDAVLRLGLTHPSAQAWLAAQWGVTDRLRQVAVLAEPQSRRRAASAGIAGYGFFAGGGETPRPAIAQLAARWPTLAFDLRPRPD